MFIDFTEFIKNTEGVVREVCSFVGADPDLYNHKPQPPGMQVVLALNSLAHPCPVCALQQALSVLFLSSMESCPLSKHRQ